MLACLSICTVLVRLDVRQKSFTSFAEPEMQYLLLIYNNEQNWADSTDADRAGMSAEYRSFTESIAKSGHYKGGNALQPVKTATTVRLRDGKRQTTDGPFAETREQLGGYYLVDAKDLDEAIGIAERIPGAKTGSIEVRPIMSMPTGPTT
jgi:hypothetical protein